MVYPTTIDLKNLVTENIYIVPKVIVSFCLRMRNEFKPFPTKNHASSPLETRCAMHLLGQLVFGGK